MDDNNHKIYVYTNKINGKKYVRQTNSSLKIVYEANNPTVNRHAVVQYELDMNLIVRILFYS